MSALNPTQQHTDSSLDWSSTRCVNFRVTPSFSPQLEQTLLKTLLRWPDFFTRQSSPPNRSAHTHKFPPPSLVIHFSGLCVRGGAGGHGLLHPPLAAVLICLFSAPPSLCLPNPTAPPSLTSSLLFSLSV